ncbi:MAG: hypothetical protein ABSF50_17300 [Burkholderiaceae bacterium]
MPKPPPQKFYRLQALFDRWQAAWGRYADALDGEWQKQEIALDVEKAEVEFKAALAELADDQIGDPNSLRGSS